ncbi:MAG TPA: RDD family protein, partial [Acidimicrobiales bacterium]|nr:RDD family protein [Acidimicrobiales bacterium]
GWCGPPARAAPDDRWAPPAPEDRTTPPTPPVGHSYYPPPAAPAAAPPGYGPGPGGGEPAYSPWWKRVVAVLVDWLVVGIPAGIAFAAAGTPFGTDPFTGEPTFEPSGAYLVAWLVSVVASLTYYVVMEGGPGGATLGKMAVGIQVRDASSFGSIGYGRALGRRLVAGLLWALFILPGLVNVLMPLWDRRRQTLHDKAVATVVVERG